MERHGKLLAASAGLAVLISGWLGAQRRCGAFAEGGERPSRVSALVFALSGDAVRPGRETIRYDFYGDGMPALAANIAPGCGILVFDADRNGISGENAREFVGSFADLDGDHRPDGYENGFHALWGLVRKAASDGVLDRNAERRQVLSPEDLVRLEAAYGLRMKLGGLGGKAVSLRAAGVGAVLLSREAPSGVSSFDDRGDGVSRQPGASFIRVDGSQGSYEEFWFRPM